VHHHGIILQRTPAVAAHARDKKYQLNSQHVNNLNHLDIFICHNWWQESIALLSGRHQWWAVIDYWTMKAAKILWQKPKLCGSCFCRTVIPYTQLWG